jgi:LysM repeat protein
VSAVCVVALTACGVAPAKQARVATPTPAAPGVSTTTSTTAPFTTYVVAQGDSLSSIATRFGTSVQAIASTNHLTNLDTLALGQVLRLPVDTSLGLSVSPHDGQPGTSFELVLTRANPSDLVTFSIAQPGHKPYTGPQHTPTPDGTVKATYQTYPGDPPGTYLVLAHTSSGKGAFTSFRVDAPSPSSS